MRNYTFDDIDDRSQAKRIGARIREIRDLQDMTQPSALEHGYGRYGTCKT